jgi:hypothetical protein
MATCSRAAQAAGYEALITGDRGIPHQQNRAGLNLSIIVLRPRTNQLEDLLRLVAAIDDALRQFNGEM